jgi:hypothetical protein
MLSKTMLIGLLVTMISMLNLVEGVPTMQSVPTVCNGHAEFCARRYSEVSVIGAHNSYSVGAGNRKLDLFIFIALHSFRLFSPY